MGKTKSEKMNFQKKLIHFFVYLLYHFKTNQ